MAKEKTDEKGQTLDERIAKRLKKETPKEEPATSVKASLPPLPPSTDVPEGKVIKKKVKTATELGATEVAEVAKEKKTRKPRTMKPKTEVGAEVSDLVTRIEARATATADKAHKEEIKKLKEDFKGELRAAVETAEKVAYAAGLKDGEKATLKSIAAQLKGK